ncbi:MAG: tetraacyldisaccharide 4'-kinase [Nitrospinae bacterium]|nr:tetraacyldisaccharide 4'-kinase [Nitrospinota bacterium]
MRFNPAPFFKLIAILLLPVSLLNSVIQSARAALYNHGLLKKQKLPAKVISIGNLSMGGSGKTPTAALVAEILLRGGKKPAILSRGYGGKRKESSPLVVSDGDKIFATWRTAGDEPFLLARSIKGVPVIVGKDRLASGRIALEKLKCDALILDDGYQRLGLERDRNLCLIDCAAKDIFEDRLFPSGRLREPVSQLKRADAILLTHWEETPGNKKMSERLETEFGKKIFRARHVPCSWLDTATGKDMALEEAKGKKILAFCGIANPSSFLDALEGMGCGPAAFLSYPDHYSYLRTDMESVKSKVEKLGANLIATTEKDWVRLEGMADFPVSLWALRIKIEILEDASFRSFLLAGDKNMRGN